MKSFPFCLCLLFPFLICNSSTLGRKLCRLSSLKMSLKRRQFESYSCGECLYYIYFIGPIGVYSTNYYFQRCITGLLVCLVENADSSWCNCSNPLTVFNIDEHAYSNSSSSPLTNLIVTPPLPVDFREFTAKCCRQAVQCCHQQLEKDSDFCQFCTDAHIHMWKVGPLHTVPSGSSRNTCPATWDGWQCFVRTEPRIVTAPCPGYIYGKKVPTHLLGSHLVQNAEKVCRPNGRWFTVNISENREQNEWTDYSKCIVQQSYKWKYLTGVGSFAITVIAIIPAIVIMSHYRVLKEQDVFVLHRNLLTSFMLCGSFFIFNSSFFIVGPGEQLYLTNHISCRILFAVHLRYLRLTTYTWMLSEGWYLHRLLATAFVQPKSLRLYYCFCWGTPIVPTLLHSISRLMMDNTDCWVSPSKIRWINLIITGPCLSSLCLNLVLLSGIIYILVRKLRFSPDLEPAQYSPHFIPLCILVLLRKAVRATFMLLPVFGLHFLLTIYRSTNVAHQIFNLMLDGLQGFFVVVIICYTNGKVIDCLKKTWRAKKDRREMNRQMVVSQMRFRRSTELAELRRFQYNN